MTLRVVPGTSSSAPRGGRRPARADRATLYTGARGAGMLNAVEDRARERGWLVVSETAMAGFVSGTGVLITLDEIHRNQIEELRELATVVQHGFREDRELAFVGAGLAASVSDALTGSLEPDVGSVLSFTRRP